MYGVIYQTISRRLEPVKPLLRSVPGFRPASLAVRYAIDGAFRAECHLRLFRAQALFQVTGHSKPNRYPALFSCLADQLRNHAAPRILSFGCSTGEEIESLRAVLPKATLVGIDINRRSIAIARRRLNAPNVTLLVAGEIGMAGNPPFDAILCMAVLQRSELNQKPPENCSAFLTFSKFEAVIADCDRCLKPGGLLALHHTTFRFADTAASRDYVPILQADPLLPKRVKYDRNNRLITMEADDEPMLYRKKGLNPSA
jgi:SAM-dependent methyltransferase